MPCGGATGQRGSLVAAEICFNALELDQESVDAKQLRLKPPKLLEFFVDKLEPC